MGGGTSSYGIGGETSSYGIPVTLDSPKKVDGWCFRVHIPIKSPLCPHYIPIMSPIMSPLSL